jgi:hypothetical protein
VLKTGFDLTRDLTHLTPELTPGSVFECRLQRRKCRFEAMLKGTLFPFP